MHVRLVERRPVDVDLLLAQLDRLTRQPDHALDEVALGLLRILEHDHVAAANGPERQNRLLDARGARAEDELVDEQMIADQEVVLHRSGRDLERLHDEGADEQRQDDGDDDRFEVLAESRFPELASHSLSVPILSTARNASCGISTLPTRFMRFLPSFCFSSSLRLREMSPP